MKKQIMMIAVLAVIIVLGAVYFLLKPEDQSPNGITVPEVNPVAETNPFSNVKTNPF